MDGFIFIIFVIIVLSMFGKSGKSKTRSKVKSRPRVKPVRFETVNTDSAGLNNNWAEQAKKLDTARRSASTGSAALERYRREQKKRYKNQMKANVGLWQSQHRIDKNRHRRTDWGSRGDKALLSPVMIGVIGGFLLTVYLGLTALYG